MSNASNKTVRSKKPALAQARPGLWINLTRPKFYMEWAKVSPKEFRNLFDKGNIGKWSPKTFSASSCGLRLTWRRDDINGSVIVDNDDRFIAGESGILEPGSELVWSCCKSARKGDLSLFYRTDPAKDIRYLLLALGDAEHYPGQRWEWGCRCQVAYKFQAPLPLEALKRIGIHPQGTAFSVDEAKWRQINEMLAELNPSYPDEVRENFGIDIFAGIPHVAASSVAVPAHPPESPDPWAASPATYERVTRPQQRKFREKLIRAYNGRCAVTGESTDVVLEAAHLPGRDHTRHNRARDGILLRIDLHRLLDKGLMTFTAKGVVQIAAEVGPEYRKFHGRKIRFPKRKADRPAL